MILLKVQVFVSFVFMEIGTINLWDDCKQCDTDSKKIDHLAKLVITRKFDNDILTSKDVCKLLDIKSNF